MGGTPLCRWKALAANAFEYIWNLNLKWKSIIYDAPCGLPISRPISLSPPMTKSFDVKQNIESRIEDILFLNSTCP
ncbi:hypothetical protein ACN38_g9423 [Penicillium nordicum]|uniref:Uncharacterized protein n=1 Tax=Penicillium nordicum TaxID=229535 RepID=A0A0M9WCK1_9EURO|nr:hypothetical protein ACN38_g9423 [Penicillium nordicum]